MTVKLENLAADLTTDLRVADGALPATIDLPLSQAATVCGVDEATLTAGGSCTATTSSEELVAALSDMLEDDEQTANPNSAKAFAPGQQPGDAKDSAPGQLKQEAGENASARDFAPDQVKKEAGEDSGDFDEEDTEAGAGAAGNAGR